jgi:hypothetical protein
VGVEQGVINGNLPTPYLLDLETQASVPTLLPSPSTDGILDHQFGQKTRVFFSMLFKYWQILQRTKLYSGFKNPFKKIHEKRKLYS